jgi:hypothetical protein
MVNSGQRNARLASHLLNEHEPLLVGHARQQPRKSAIVGVEENQKYPPPPCRKRRAAGRRPGRSARATAYLRSRLCTVVECSAPSRITRAAHDPTCTPFANDGRTGASNASSGLRAAPQLIPRMARRRGSRQREGVGGFVPLGLQEWSIRRRPPCQRRSRSSRCA